MAKAKDKTIEALLKEAGFSTVRKINDRIIHAMVDQEPQKTQAERFGKAHAAAIQAACNCPEYQGCFRYPCMTGPVLIVHVKEVTEESGTEAQSELPAGTPDTANSEPQASNL